jgi:hypothetical protein
MVERKDAVVMRDGEEPDRAEALVEGVREGIADPAERGVAGAVIKGQNEHDTAASVGWRLCGGEVSRKYERQNEVLRQRPH